jgi:hypothetical protein
MNPYFEQLALWQDFLTEFLTALRRQLAPRIGPRYIVQLEEHEYIPRSSFRAAPSDRPR